MSLYRMGIIYNNIVYYSMGNIIYYIISPEYAHYTPVVVKFPAAIH